MSKDQEKKNIQLSIRFTESQFKEIQEMAKEVERTEADFIRIATMKYITIKKESDKM